METLMTAIVLLFALGSVWCRIGRMQHKVTRMLPFVQYSALGLGIMSGLLLLVVAPNLTALALGAGVALFLALGAYRWKDGAPADIYRPDPISPLEFPRISGGTKK